VSNLKQALGLKEADSPFPWQEEMPARFLAGIGNRMSLDIPTGLGKTSVMAAWLVARSQDLVGGNLPGWKTCSAALTRWPARIKMRRTNRKKQWM